MQVHRGSEGQELGELISGLSVAKMAGKPHVSLR
jgi:hypothetical protein